MDVALQLTQAFLLGDSETLLLVDDHQAQAGHVDVTAQESVGTDENVNLARRQTLADRLDLGRRTEAGNHLDLEIQALEAPPERAQVLIGENRRRRHDRDLQAVVHRLERRPHRHLGLAEADVAAQKPVHRLLAAQILLDRAHRLQLIRRLLVGEGALELELAVAVLVHRHRPRQPPLRVELQQIAGDRLQAATDPALLLRPTAAAQLVETGREPIDAAVALDLVQASQRQEQRAARRIEKLHDLDRPRRPAGSVTLYVGPVAGRTFKRPEPQELPDAVLLVDHELADPQIPEAGHEGPHPAMAGRRGPAPEELPFAEEHEPGCRKPEPPFQLAVDQPHAASIPVDLAAAECLTERLVPHGPRH